MFDESEYKELKVYEFKTANGYDQVEVVIYLYKGFPKVTIRNWWIKDDKKNRTKGVKIPREILEQLCANFIEVKNKLDEKFPVKTGSTENSPF